MQELVGIIHTEGELKSALERIAAPQGRAARVGVEGIGSTTRAGTWPSTCAPSSRCPSAWPWPRWSATQAAAATRDDYPKPDQAGKVKIGVVRSRDGKVNVSREPLDDLPDDLRQLFEEKPRT